MVSVVAEIIREGQQEACLIVGGATERAKRDPAVRDRLLRAAARGALAGAESLAGKAISVRAVTGLQGRCAPEVEFARQLIEDGYVGRVLATCSSPN
jgi:hypothetical protein